MRKDILSNYFAQAINILLRFFLIPLYLSKLGTAAYGIIGFYVSIESIMVLLDFGLGVASSKLIAEKFGKEPTLTTAILKKIEGLYLIISILIGAVVFILAPVISSRWLNIDDQSINGVETILFIALLLTVSWPKSLYENFLIGQKRIVWKNNINISCNIGRTAAMICCFYMFSGNISTYFLVMIITVLFEVILLRIFAFKRLVKQTVPVNWLDLSEFMKYTSGIGIFSVLSLFVFQGDKFFISKYLPISALGIYNLTSVLPMVIFAFMYPITSAIFPRLVEAYKNHFVLGIYKQWTLLLGVLCISYLALLSTNFSYIISLWLKAQAETVNIKVGILLLIGVVIHGLSNINISLLLANGRSRAVAIIYGASVVVYLLMLILTAHRGMILISVSWIVCNMALLCGSLIALFLYYRIYFKAFSYNLVLLISFLGSFFALFFTLTNYRSFVGFDKLLLSSILLIALILVFFLKNIKMLFTPSYPS